MAMAITANAAELTAKENAIIDIGAWTARGGLCRCDNAQSTLRSK